MIPALERNHVVVHTRALNFWVVFKMELFSLKVGLGQGSCCDGDAGSNSGKCEVSQNVLLLLLGEVPKDYDAVREDEHLAKGQGVGRNSGILGRVSAIVHAVPGLVELVVVAYVVGLLVAKVAFVVVALLVALDLFVEHRLSTRALERRATAHPVAVAAGQQREMVDGVETVVVQLGAGIVCVLYELGGALHLVGLGGAVGGDARELVRPLGLGQTLCIALVVGTAFGGPSRKVFVCGRAFVFVFVKVALLVVLLSCCLGQKHEFFAELARSGGHVLGYQATGESGIERMPSAGSARVHHGSAATARRAASLLL